MVRIEAVFVCALLGASPVGAQGRAGDLDGEGPPPLDTTQSISAGADDDIGEGARNGHAGPRAGAPGHTSGSYAGVVPGTAKQAPPAAKVARASNGPTITWPGFQMRPDGSSRVFIQSTAALEPTVVNGGGAKFELQLPRARVAAKTNRLPLDTRFFNTPVTKISVSVASGGAVVQLELRADVKPTVSNEVGPAGYFFTYIELPKGDYLARPGAQVQADKSEAAPPPASSSNTAGNASASAAASASGHEAEGAVRGEASVRAGFKIGR